jgi:hypothetical protein
VVLPPLKLLVGIQIRVLVVKPHHHADLDHIGLHVVQKGAAVHRAEGRFVQRPPHCVLNETGSEVFLRDLPHLLDSCRMQRQPDRAEKSRVEQSERKRERKRERNK